MSLLDKMERKFGKFAIPNLMKYILAIYVVGWLLRIATPGVYETYFMLDASQITVQISAITPTPATTPPCASLRVVSANW